MNEEPAPTESEDKNIFSWGRFILWSVLCLVFYVLSIGPAVLLDRKGCFNSSPNVARWLDAFYSPLVWVDRKTPLGKPLELYIQLWDPAYRKNKGK